MITGNKVTSPTKKELAHAIADFLKLEHPTVAEGSSVDSPFLQQITSSLNGPVSSGSDSYRKTETIFDLLGLTYDPFWDTSEAQDIGGSTVTNRAFSRILAALTQTPRCFLLNVNDAPNGGARWESNPHEVYRYDDKVTGRGSLNDAGPGSKVVHYATSKSSAFPKHYIAIADIDYISPGWDGPWEARLANYQQLATPIPAQAVDISGRNMQHAITEISFATYMQIVDEGGATNNLQRSPFSGPIDFNRKNQMEDLGSARTAERVLSEFPPNKMSIPISIPSALVSGPIELTEPHTPSYSETEDTLTSKVSSSKQRRKDSKLPNKMAEERAIEIAKRAMLLQGWTMSGDRQLDGVGYDLEFKSGNRELHIEVKGIQGPNCDFNMTPKETWRAETDDDWAIIAVTSVLAPEKFTAQMITREQLRSAERTVLSYRVIVGETF